MPLIHITSRAIYDRNGREKSTGFIENIEKNGLRRRDTNVGVFVEHGREASIAKPDYYIEQPVEFIKSIKNFLQRYVHHGLRTNKNALNQLKNSSQVAPAMIVIDGSLALEHGSDYDDHYILKNKALPKQIIGTINLDKNYQPSSQEAVAYIATEILKLLASRSKYNNDR